MNQLNELQLELTKLLGKNGNTPPTLTDLHRFMNENKIFFEMAQNFIRWWFSKEKTIPYDSSKELLDQDPETLEKIKELIKTNS